MTDARQRITKKIVFPDSMHDSAFALWYKLGKPMYKDLAEVIKTELHVERAPLAQTLRAWKETEDWEARADDMDGKIQLSTDKIIIKQRQDIIKKLANVGNELVEMGMSFLKNNGIENSADAIRAIGKGAELEDKLLGWAAYYAEISKGSEADLDRELAKFMTPDIPNGEIIEATVKDEEPERPEDQI
jgi:hypothetical protein